MKLREGNEEQALGLAVRGARAMDSIETILVITVAVLTIIGYVTGFFRRVWQEFVSRVRRESPYLPLPKRSITMVPEREEDFWWHMGGASGQPAMQIAGRFKATNIIKYDVLLIAAKLRKPRRLGMVITKDVGSQYHGEYRIPPGDTTEISVDFWVIPPVEVEGQDFVSDLAVLDQFGNHHWVRKVRFQYR